MNNPILNFIVVFLFISNISDFTKLAYYKKETKEKLEALESRIIELEKKIPK